jgi:hypothetical protein
VRRARKLYQGAMAREAQEAAEALEQMADQLYERIRQLHRKAVEIVEAFWKTRETYILGGGASETGKSEYVAISCRVRSLRSSRIELEWILVHGKTSPDPTKRPVSLISKGRARHYTRKLLDGYTPIKLQDDVWRTEEAFQALRNQSAALAVAKDELNRLSYHLARHGGLLRE